MKHQIQIDVIRTKKWKGEDYQNRLSDILLNFFEHENPEMEYFQGFNYILAFLTEVFDKDHECIIFANYLAFNIIPVYLVGVLF